MVIGAGGVTLGMARDKTYLEMAKITDYME